MKKICNALTILLFIVACHDGKYADNDLPSQNTAQATDTIKYAYKAVYSSNISVPANPINAQKALTVWRMFEKADFDGMKPYWADSVTYHDASGLLFRGSRDDLLKLAKSDIEGLDSLRFDISVWQAEHVNDRNEDWVRIWATERRYPKNQKADTFLIQENWKVENGKFSFFDQYKARATK